MTPWDEMPRRPRREDLGKRVLVRLHPDQSPHQTTVKEFSPSLRYVHLLGEEVDSEPIYPSWRSVEEVEILEVLPHRAPENGNRVLNTWTTWTKWTGWTR